MVRTSSSDVSGWVGWVYFAGMVMVLVGIFQAIAGFVALFKDTVYFVGARNYWVLDYTTWGWAHLLLGLFVMMAGLAIMSGKMWGRVVGILLASLSAIANFAFIPVYPWWSVLMLVIDFLVIYALIVHGKEAVQELE